MSAASHRESRLVCLWYYREAMSILVVLELKIVLRACLHLVWIPPFVSLIDISCYVYNVDYCITLLGAGGCFNSVSA